MTDETPSAHRAPDQPTAAAPDRAPDHQTAAAPDPAGSTPNPPGEPPEKLERVAVAGMTARDVDLRLGAIGALDAEEVLVGWGAIGAARADRVGVELGSLGAALAGEARVSLGVAGSIAAREAVLEQSFVRTLVAQHVTATRPTGVLVMIAQHVSGDVRPLLDWRGALVAGTAFGLVTALARAFRARG
jgi:hypothetical protein